jgi:hypothetical protein
MADTVVSETVTRPVATSFATGAYSGDEFIDQNGSALSLDLIKSGQLSVTPGSNAPPYSISADETLSTTANKVQTLAGTQLTLHFDLSVDATVQLTGANGTVNPFTTSLEVSGDVVVMIDKCGNKSCQVDYWGTYGGQNVCGGSSGPPKPAFTLNADTAYNFDNPGANGYAAIIVANGQPTSPATGAFVTDAATAQQGAHGLVLGAGALLLSFGSASEDPVQGVGLGDSALIAALGSSASAMVAQPNSQDVAVNAALIMTDIGAALAISDTLAAYDVASDQGAQASPIGAGLDPVHAMVQEHLQLASQAHGGFPFS